MDSIQRLLIDLYRAARESPIPEFQERSFKMLKSLCRADSAMAATASLDPVDGLTFHSISLQNIPEEFISAHEEIASEDIIAAEVARRAGTVCAINLRDLMPARKFPGVCAFDARFELQNMLGEMEIEPATGAIRGLFLWRARDADRFSEDERRLGEIFLPHAIEAAAVNRQLWLSEVTSGAIARRGVRALANLRGVLHTYDASFIELLRAEWPQWRPPILPVQLLGALTAHSDSHYSGLHISVAAEFKRGMLFLMAREKRGLGKLSAAELSAARLIADGLSYKEAATRLGIAAATIRNQVHAVYAKLGVRNKAALARWLNQAAR